MRHVSFPLSSVASSRRGRGCGSESGHRAAADSTVVAATDNGLRSSVSRRARATSARLPSSRREAVQLTAETERRDRRDHDRCPGADRGPSPERLLPDRRRSSARPLQPVWATPSTPPSSAAVRQQLWGERVEELRAVVAYVVDGGGDRPGVQVAVGGLGEQRPQFVFKSPCSSTSPTHVASAPPRAACCSSTGVCVSSAAATSRSIEPTESHMGTPSPQRSWSQRNTAPWDPPSRRSTSQSLVWRRLRQYLLHDHTC